MNGFLVQARRGMGTSLLAVPVVMASTSTTSLTWAASVVREVIDILLRFQDGGEIPEDLLDSSDEARTCLPRTSRPRYCWITLGTAAGL